MFIPKCALANSRKRAFYVNLSLVTLTACFLRIFQMKNKLLWMGLIVLCGNGYAADFVDQARVVSSKPIYESVNEPHQECTTETVQRAPQRSMGGSVVGGLVGGLAGSQIGRGRGKTAATAAGAIAGALIGNEVGSQGQPTSEQVQNCQTVDDYHDVVKGYSVIYRYNGREVTTTLPYQPGRVVKVGVSLIQEAPKSNDRYDRRDRRDYNDGRD
jgi:uncharacterized protein YcfJ